MKTALTFLIGGLLASVCWGAGAPGAAQAVQEVLATNERMLEVIRHNRGDELGQFFAADCLVHGSSNEILDCREVVERFRSGKLSFSAYERKIERTLVNGDVVVLMGEEIVTAAGEPGARPIHRRITSAWRKIDGRWQQFARQSTVVPAKD